MKEMVGHTVCSVVEELVDVNLVVVVVDEEVVL